MNEKQLREQAEEAGLKVALLYLPEPDDTESGLRPAPSELASMRRRLRRAARRNPHAWGVKYRLAAALAAVFLLIPISVYALPNLLNYFVERYASYVAISHIPENAQPQYVLADTFPMPQYIPAGYCATVPAQCENYRFIQFINARNETIDYCYYSDGEVILDSENASRIEPLTINRQNGLLVICPDGIELTWGMRPAYLLKSSGASTGELIKMAESIGQGGNET